MLQRIDPPHSIRPGAHFGVADDAAAIARLRELLSSREADLRDIAALVTTSPALRRLVLHAANAVQLALPRQVTSPAHAVALLGLRRIAFLLEAPPESSRALRPANDPRSERDPIDAALTDLDQSDGEPQPVAA